MTLGLLTSSLSRMQGVWDTCFLLKLPQGNTHDFPFSIETLVLYTLFCAGCQKVAKDGVDRRRVALFTLANFKCSPMTR
jgi:hypothetical protein